MVTPSSHRRRLLAVLCVLGSGVVLLLLVPRPSGPSEPPGGEPPRPSPTWLWESPFERLQTAAGPVQVAKRVLPSLPLLQLSAAVGTARAAGLTSSEAEPWRLQADAACGWFLRDRADDVRVLPTAVLRRAEIERRDGRAERRALTRAARHLAEALSEELEPGRHVALRNMLRRLSLPDDNPDATTVNPAYARLVVASGWLADMTHGAHAVARRSTEEALARAMAMQPEKLWSGEGHQLARVADAWGGGGVVYRAPDRTVVVLVPPSPMDDRSRHDALASCETVIELAPEADPVADPAAVAAARRVALLHDGVELVAWTREDGARVDPEAWRGVFGKSRGRRAAGEFPPHVVLGGLDRSVHGLIVAAGLLRPVANDSHEEGERFLEDAARLLPDAVHLDLVQQYLMKWVYDSPDPTQPLAIGCEQANGDIHQTAHQVLATTAGGISRGDCDDFAELAWAIARRQGRPAHVLSVPQHLAATWAEPRDDGWHVFVLQTGPVLDFREPTLARALYETYAYYDDTEPVDVDALPVSVRFAGESLRGVYALSWRIFAEPDYATALLGVQEDWHDSTLLQATRTMRALIEGGDRDPANYAELGALYAATGQYGKAAAAHLEASRQARAPEGRVHRLVDVFDDLVAGERMSAAVTLGDKLSERWLPAMAPVWGARTAQVRIEMASSLARHGEPVPAARLLAEALRRPPDDGVAPLGDLVGDGVGLAAWGGSREQRLQSDLLSQSAHAALAVLEPMDASAVRSDRHVRAVRAHLTAWLRNVAFTGLDDRDEELRRWALYGRWLRLEKPEGFLQRLEAAPPPGHSMSDAHHALARTPENPAVLSWIRISPYSATWRLDQLVAPHAQRPDPALVRRWGTLLEEGIVAARRLGYDIEEANRAVHAARLQVALLTHQQADLRRLFAKAQRLGDSRLRDRTVRTIAQVAPHLDPETWARVVACWIEEVDYRPNYFALAWAAALAGAPEHGLHVADLAATRFASDAAFVEEARSMHELLGE